VWFLGGVGFGEAVPELYFAGGEAYGYWAVGWVDGHACDCFVFDIVSVCISKMELEFLKEYTY
jgi:hypothetical protein